MLLLDSSPTSQKSIFKKCELEGKSDLLKVWPLEVEGLPFSALCLRVLGDFIEWGGRTQDSGLEGCVLKSIFVISGGFFLCLPSESSGLFP